MKAVRRWVLRTQQGMEAVEGMIVMTMMIFILVLFLSLGFLFYQRWVVSSVANDTASRIAQSYAYPEADPVMGYISRAMKLSVSPFRYLGSGLENKNSEKGKQYALWSLEQVSMATLVSEPTIEVRTVNDTFAQSHVEAEITATYEIPFGGVLEYFGLSREVTYHAVGYAMTTDISHYMRSVDTLTALSSNTFGNSVLGAINSVLKAIQDIAGLFG